MLRKIDCIMIRVNDVAEALNFYSDVFGLKPVWQDQNAGQAGLLFPESDAEIVLHTDTKMPGQVEVHYLVDDVPSAVQKYVAQGCTLLTEPFDIRIGKCAVIQDPFGTRLCILDMSKQQPVDEALF
ncbi:MAG TPA: VOC family protein [Ktedonobacteraceae bacterium]|nr:VOC family protein [Ktedonobacteraceae bacterium]